MLIFHFDFSNLTSSPANTPTVPRMKLFLIIPCLLLLVERSCGSLETNSIETLGANGRPFKVESKNRSRFLRGGSYSRGGSSSSYSYNRGGGSSYNWNRNRNRSSSYNNGARRSGGFGRILGGLAAAAVGLAVLGMLFGGAGAGLCTALCCGATGAAVGATAAAGANRYNNNYYSASEPHQNYMNKNYNGNNQSDFDMCVQQARREVDNAFTSMNQTNCQPYSGQYTTVFVDPESGVHHNASLCIFFTPDPQRQGFRISGQGSDIDGNTVIEDGFAKYDGTTWWIEKTISGDIGLAVLSRGKFNFYQHTFDGTWLANTMLSGPYLSFTATMVQDQQARNIQSGSANVPVVTGVVVQDGYSNNTQYSYGNNGRPVTVMGQAL